MKILFVDPPGYQRQGFNLGLAMLCAALTRDGHQALVFDRNEGGDLGGILAGLKPDLVGVSIKSATFSAGKRLARQVKSACPGALILGGGPHPTIAPADMLKTSRYFDLALAGEAERSVVELVRRLQGANGAVARRDTDGSMDVRQREALAELVAGVEGISYRDGEGQVITSPPAVVQELDELAYPRLESFINLDAGARPYHLMTSRGCPFRCAYCSVRSIAGRKLRTRSVESVVEEVLYARSCYGIETFEVDDDNFTLQLDRAKLICEAMVQRRVDLPWYLPNGIRAEMLDRELAHLLKLANCHTVALGIETADPQVLKMIHKGLQPEAVRRAVSLLHAAGIRVMGFFIIGLPGADLTSDLHTIEFERSLPLDDRIYNAFVPYPCTEGYEWAKENGHFLADYRDALHFSDSENTVFETSAYPAGQRKAALTLARLGTKELHTGDFQLLRELVLSGLAQDTLLVEVESYHPNLHEVLQLFTTLTVVQVRDRTDNEVVCIEPDGHISHRSPLLPGWQNDLSLAYGLARALAGRRFQLAIVPQIHSYLVLSMLARCTHRFQYSFTRQLSSTDIKEILLKSPRDFLRLRLRAGLGRSLPDPVRGVERGFRLAEDLSGVRRRLSDARDTLERIPDWLGGLPATALVGATTSLSIAALRLRRALTSDDQ